MRPYLLGSGVHNQYFNTKDDTGEPVTLAGTPSLRQSINGASGIAAGITLDVDFDGIEGKHQGAIDVDNVTADLGDGDEGHPYLHAGTADGHDGAGTQPAGLEDYVAVAAGLSTAERAHIQTEVEEGVAVAMGDVTGAVVDHVNNSASTFAITTDSVAKTLTGYLIITSGALANEKVYGRILGTNFLALSDDDMETPLRQLSAEPVADVTYIFRQRA